MKHFLVFTFVFVFSINISQAQRDRVIYKQDWDMQRVFWGYYLGINKKDFKISYLNNDNTFIEVTPSIGFNVGLIGDLRIHKNLSLRLEPGLSSNTKKLLFTHIEGTDNQRERDVNSTYLRFPLLLKFNTDRLDNVRPYLIGGVSYDYNFSSNQDNPNDNLNGEFRTKKSNFSYEFGAGIDIYLPYFIFSPSIRGVFAINNEIVKDVDPNSPWTGNIDYFGTRGFFVRFAFH